MVRGSVGASPSRSFEGVSTFRWECSLSVRVLNRTGRLAWRGPRANSHRGILASNPGMRLDEARVGGNHVGALSRLRRGWVRTGGRARCARDYRLELKECAQSGQDARSPMRRGELRPIRLGEPPSSGATSQTQRTSLQAAEQVGMCSDQSPVNGLSRPPTELALSEPRDDSCQPPWVIPAPPNATRPWSPRGWRATLPE